MILLQYPFYKLFGFTIKNNLSKALTHKFQVETSPVFSMDNTFYAFSFFRKVPLIIFVNKPYVNFIESLNFVDSAKSFTASHDI